MPALTSRLLVATAALAMAWPALAQKRSPAAADAPVQSTSAAKMSEVERTSYASGVSAIRNFTKSDLPFDLNALVQGIKDAAGGKELALSESDIRMVMNQLQTDLRRQMASNRKDLLEKNRNRGTAFLADFKTKPGVKTLSNGVAYRVIQEGNGPKPTDMDTVVTRYRGTLLDGTVFDATPEGKTSALRINATIMGWREALKQMPAGSKWELVIPSPLAYGERGVGDVIGPNETLMFEVELLEIKR